MADVFYRSGEIESWGSGFDKIKMECDRESAPYPIINANPKGGVELECDACELYMKLLKYGRYYDTYPQESQTIESSPTVDKMMEILSRELSDKEKEKILPIVDFLKTHDTITRQQAEQLTGKGAATAKRYLQRLVKLNVLNQVGESVAAVYKRI